MYVQYTGVRNFLLRLPGRERHRLHLDPFEKIQHTIGKNETGVVHVELCLCRVLIHDYKGTSFHGVYFHGWIIISYQTRIFACDPN